MLLKRANLSVLPAFHIPRSWLVRSEVSVIIGSLLLSLLLKESEEKDGGKAGLDKVIARYNQGYFYRPRGTTEQIVASAPKEVAGYVLKLVGINSTLDQHTE